MKYIPIYFDETNAFFFFALSVLICVFSLFFVIGRMLRAFGQTDLWAGGKFSFSLCVSRVLVLNQRAKMAKGKFYERIPSITLSRFF